MKIEYVIKYYDDRNGLELKEIQPHSDYLEEAFFNGSLLYSVNLEEPGLYRLTVTLSEDGEITPVCKEEYLGWVLVDV
jgi:hypothetical protein